MTNETKDTATQWIRLEGRPDFIKAQSIERVRLCEATVIADLVCGDTVRFADLSELTANYQERVLGVLMGYVAQGTAGLLDCNKLKASYLVRCALSGHKLTDFLTEDDLSVLANIPKTTRDFILAKSLEGFCCGFRVYSTINTTPPTKTRSVQDEELAARNVLSAIYDKINETGLFPFKVKEDMLNSIEYAFFDTMELLEVDCTPRKNTV